jgi:SAM-dependent methyltransferase
MLNEENLKLKYELFDHKIPYLLKANQEIDLFGKSVLEVGGSLPAGLVLEDIGAKQWTAIEEIDYWNEISAELPTNNISPIETAKYKSTIKYQILTGGIENLPESFYQKFDVIFSIATFEHIAKLPDALDKMYKALRPGGKVFSLFSPIWSAHDGHHLTDVYDEYGNFYYFGKSPIPPWSHLLMRPIEMYDYLINANHSRSFANKVIYYIYNSNHINRFMFEDYVDIINRTYFSKKSITPFFDSQIPNEIHQRLEKKYGIRNFSSNGMLVLLER